MTVDAKRSLEEFARSLKWSDALDARTEPLAAADHRVARSFGQAEPGRNAGEVVAKPEGLPRGLVIVMEICVALGIIAAVVLGPAYYTCQRMKDGGLFFYGTTIRSCMWDRVGETAANAESFVRGLTAGR